MKRSVIAASAFALLATLTVASAAEVTGKIKFIDDNDHRVTLSSGKSFTYAADPGEPNEVSILDRFHPGEKVRIIHSGGVATGITALN